MEPNENYFNYQSMCGRIPISPAPQMMSPQQLNTVDALMHVTKVVCELRHKYVYNKCSQFDVNDLNDILILTNNVSILIKNMAEMLQHIKQILGSNFGDQFMIRSAAESFSGSCMYAKNVMFDF